MHDWTYFAIARCQQRCCHGASLGLSAASVHTPERKSLPEVRADIEALDSRARRCGYCHRPIAAKRFDIRRWLDVGDDDELVVELLQDDQWARCCGTLPEEAADV